MHRWHPAHPHMDETRLGSILLESRIIGEQHLEKCLEIQALTGLNRPLGQILIEQGFLDKARLEQLLELQKARAHTARERGAYRADQFNLEGNPAAHEETAAEIWDRSGGEVGAFCDFLGTGGTVAGMARFFKAQDPSIACYVVEPAGAAVLAGETAPLLFTALNNRFFSTSLTQPISSLTVQVYTYASSPSADWHRQAWAGALVLVSIVLLCSVLARMATRRLEHMQAR